MQNIKISFLVTYYNQREYVAESLNSILKIHIPCDYEVLVGDDGSADGTLEEVEKWRDSFGERLRVFKIPRDHKAVYNPVIRAGNLRRYLLKQSTGDYFCILDGDDYYCDDNFIQEALNVYGKHPDVSVVMFNYCKVYTGQTACAESLPEEGLTESGSYIRNYYKPAGACLLKRFPDSGFFKQVSAALYYDDTDIVTFNLVFGRLWYIDKVVYSYRQHENSIWNSMNRAQQGILNLLGADNQVFLAPRFKNDIYYRFREDILYAYFRRKCPESSIGTEFYKEYLELCKGRRDFISRILLAYDKSSREDRDRLEVIIKEIRIRDPDTYVRVEEAVWNEGRKNNGIREINTKNPEN